MSLFGGNFALLKYLLYIFLLLSVQLKWKKSNLEPLNI